MACSAGSRRIRAANYLVLAAIGLWLGTPAASAQNRLGGHFGAVFPLVTRADGETVNIGDDFVVGFPMGITIRKNDTFAFDIELVPALDFDDDGPVRVPLTIHPGILQSLGGAWTGGLRMAFDVDGASWGLTPLLNLGVSAGEQPYFVEFVFPIRFQDDDVGDTTNSVGFGIHLGVGF
jgi:hypothetical protein